MSKLQWCLFVDSFYLEGKSMKKMTGPYFRDYLLSFLKFATYFSHPFSIPHSSLWFSLELLFFSRWLFIVLVLQQHFTRSLLHAPCNFHRLDFILNSLNIFFLHKSLKVILSDWKSPLSNSNFLRDVDERFILAWFMNVVLFNRQKCAKH